MLQYQRISRQLLTRVLSVYLLLTLIITCIHIAGEYFNTKRYILSELKQQQYTIGSSLTRSVWEFNDPNTTAIIEGLINMPSVGGVILRDDSGNVIIQRGTTFSPEQLTVSNEAHTLSDRSGVFGHYSPLIFELSEQPTRAGDVAIFSNRDIAFERLKVNLFFLIGNAIIKSTLLVLIFSFAFSRLLNRPFQQLSKQIENFHINDLDNSRIQLKEQHNNEFIQVENAYNRLIDNLQRAQSQLVESEKMASLGGLVAGIAHDVNTPIGISVTASSFLADRVEQLAIALDENSLTQSHLQQFIADSRESARLLDSNLNRANDLIESFKQVAVDQTSDALRDINLHEYVEGVVQSLRPKLKTTNHTVQVECDSNIQIRCLAGSLAQILTNMILNSLVHAFEGVDNGVILIRLRVHNDTLHCTYQDNGNGISEENLQRIFDPFFTTKPNDGGSGLGTHIIRNLVQTLQGDITAHSAPGRGLRYDFHFPVAVLGA